MVVSPKNANGYETNDFSALNKFIDDEKKFTNSYKSQITTEYLRLFFLYLGIFIICLGIFLVLLAYSDHIRKSEKVIQKVVYEDRVIDQRSSADKTEDDQKSVFEKIIGDNESNQYNRETANVSTMKEYVIFTAATFTDSKNNVYEVNTGHRFKKDEFKSPYTSYCYLQYDTHTIRLYRADNLPSFHARYKNIISYDDFIDAREKCQMDAY